MSLYGWTGAAYMLLDDKKGKSLFWFLNMNRHYNFMSLSFWLTGELNHKIVAKTFLKTRRMQPRRKPTSKRFLAVTNYPFCSKSRWLIKFGIKLNIHMFLRTFVGNVKFCNLKLYKGNSYQNKICLSSVKIQCPSMTDYNFWIADSCHFLL